MASSAESPPASACVFIASLSVMLHVGRPRGRNHDKRTSPRTTPFSGQRCDRTRDTRLHGDTMMQPPARACGALAGNYAPIIAFELARSAADLQAIFGATAERMPQRDDRAHGCNQLDRRAGVHSPVRRVHERIFSGMRTRRPGAARAGAGFTALAVCADYLENLCLMQLTPALDAGSIWFTLLPWATGVKWLALAAAAASASLIYMRGAPRNYVAAALCLVGLLVTIAAIAAPAQLGPWISAGVGASWCVFLVSASIGVVRGLGRIDRQSRARAAQVSCRPCVPNDATQKRRRGPNRRSCLREASWLNTETLSNGTVTMRFPGGKLPAARQRPAMFVVC